MAENIQASRPTLTALRAVKGMNDLLPPESAAWEWFDDAVRRVMRRHGYQFIRTPIVEPTALFVRGLGEVTDRLTLRPEGTAGVVRAVTEHNLLYEGGKRLWYAGPMFRHERPQKGRYRQFHQVGAEVMGHAGPDVDAEIILLLRALWRELGLVVGEGEGAHLRLELNSLGEVAERQAHRAALVAHFEAHASLLDEDARRRLHSNPLRILDTKNPAMQAVVEAAPKLIDFLGAASLAHFDAVRAVLDAAGLPYRVNPRLVRGMDYYNRTVFEWVTERLGAQGTVCGGGRYDGLVEQLGGKPAPGVGFGIGVERMLLLLAEAGRLPAPPAPDAYAVVTAAGALPQVLVALDALRAAGVSVLMHAGGGSMKSQFKKADASGARHALIFGDDELARGEVSIKPLRGGGEQRPRPLAQVADWAAELLPA
jgi:histidyl-tRNA synthetase